MKRFRGIIESETAPDTSNIWINDGALKYFSGSGWELLAGGSGGGGADLDEVNRLIQAVENNFTSQLNSKQDTLKAGKGIEITGNTISSTSYTKEEVDVMVGIDATIENEELVLK